MAATQNNGLYKSQIYEERRSTGGRGGGKGVGGAEVDAITASAAHDAVKHGTVDVRVEKAYFSTMQAIIGGGLSQRSWSWRDQGEEEEEKGEEEEEVREVGTPRHSVAI